MAVAAARFEDWLPESEIEKLSRSRHDPPALASRRHEAYAKFLELPLEPNPLYRKYGYFSGVDLSGLNIQASGSALPGLSTAPRTITAIHDAAGSHFDVPVELVEDLVVLESIEEVLQKGGPELELFLGGVDPLSDRLSAFAFATTNRGYRLTIPPKLTRPVRLRDVTVLSTPHEGLSVRRQIRSGAGTRLLVSEEALSTEDDPGHQRLVASTTRLEVGAEAQVAYVTLHAPDKRAIAVYQRSAVVETAARLNWTWGGFGGFRTKARNHSTLRGNGSSLDDLQAFYGSGSTSYDSGVVMVHEGTDTHGQSITRGVFTDEARGMSRGLVRIEHEARKTLSFLSEHAMLLSRGARSDTVPILEILCRDVKATHSSSVAPVDPERVFYLESRGISRSDSIRLIGEGFLSHVLERAPIVGLRELLYPYLAARWEGRPIVWGPTGVSTLPPLEFAAAAESTDWRFDSKLR
ncbi:MAG: SufD family Fe-S cluster assembly protein [Thermoplasmata archaeon]|nr:SufD family Fe-S cluster assembly protein [Thermoplasmata archaeon]